MTAVASNNVDRAAAYGDGVFETIAIRDGRPRFWEAHVERLHTGCSRLKIPCPDPGELARMLDVALQEWGTDPVFATARLVVAAADSPRGYRRAVTNAAKYTWEIFAAARLPQDRYTEGVATRQCQLQLAVQPALAGVKSLNRLEQVLARSEWDDPKIFEGLLSDVEGRLICGTMSNVFVVLNSSVVTPALTRCGVAGVMRAQVLGMLRAANIPCEVRDIETSELSKARECFLANSQFGVLPVRRCDDIEWEIGSFCRETQALAVANGIPECSP